MRTLSEANWRNLYELLTSNIHNLTTNLNPALLAPLTGTISTVDENIHTTELEPSTIAQLGADATRMAAETRWGQDVMEAYRSKAADAFMCEERGLESGDSSQVGGDQATTL